MKVLVIGGTGVISRQIVPTLLKEGHEVTTFNRGKRGLEFGSDVKQLTGDKFNREEFEFEMRRHKFDAVIDMVCYNEEDAKSIMRAFKENVNQIIVCSSAAAYRRPFKGVPISEEVEELVTEKTFLYGYHKAEMERYLNKEMAKGKVGITIIRPSLTFGTGSANVGVLRQNYGIIDRIKKHKPLIMFGDGTTPWSFTFASDLARGFVGCIGNEAAYNQAFHITSEEVHIWEDLYLEIGKIIGIEPIIKHIPSELLVKADESIFSHLVLEKTYCGIFDNSKIKKAIPGFKAEISLNQGLKTIMEWYESDGCKVDFEKDILEDKLVGLYDKWAEEVSAIKSF